MNPSETAEHKRLKRLALIWAQAHGYRAAAAEVSLPNYRFRLDVAAYRPESIREAAPGGRMRQRQTVGVTAVFECKASKPDFLRDARSIEMTSERLKILHARRARIEQEPFSIWSTGRRSGVWCKGRRAIWHRYISHKIPRPKCSKVLLLTVTRLEYFNLAA